MLDCAQDLLIKKYIYPSFVGVTHFATLNAQGQTLNYLEYGSKNRLGIGQYSWNKRQGYLKCEFAYQVTGGCQKRREKCFQGQ